MIRIAPSVAPRLRFYLVDSDYEPVTDAVYTDVTTAKYRTITDGLGSALSSAVTLTADADIEDAISAGQFVVLNASEGLYAIDCPSGAALSTADAVEVEVAMIDTTQTAIAILHEIDVATSTRSDVTTTAFEARTLVAASYSTHDAAAVKTAMEADGGKLDHLHETTQDNGSGVRQFTVDALEHAPTGGGGSYLGPTVVEIREEMDDNSSKFAAIIADTNELQVNQGNWVTATGFSTHAAADVAALMEADGSMLDHLWEMTQDNGSGTRQFTVNAVENAPSGTGASAASIRAEMDANSTQLASIVSDTNELQTNQGNWVTATGFAPAAGVTVTDISAAALAKFVTDDTGETAAASGSVAELSHGVVGDITDQLDRIESGVDAFVGTGEGPWGVTFTVENSVDDSALENAMIRVTEGIDNFTATTDASGNTPEFGLRAATYNVRISKAGFGSYAGTLTVTADATPTIQLTASGTIIPPAEPGLATGLIVTYDEDGAVETGVELVVVLTGGPGVAGSAYDTKPRTFTSGAGGLAQVTGLVHGATYSISRGVTAVSGPTFPGNFSAGGTQSFVVPVADSFDIPEVTGQDAEV